MQHAIVVSEVLSARGLGRVAAVRTSTLAGVEEIVDRRVTATAQEEETTAPQARAVGLDHGQGRAGGDGGVEGIAAGVEHLLRGGSGGGVSGGNGGLLRGGMGQQAGAEQQGR